MKVMLSDGQVTYTDEQGNYRFESVSSPNVTVIPCLEGKVNGALSAQDGALVLESITAEQSSLTDLQFIAADVDGDGVLTALDAAYILQKSVGILEGAFPGSGAEWYFDGAKSFTLTANKSGVDFTGILLGDVTGNWSAAAQE